VHAIAEHLGAEIGGVGPSFILSVPGNVAVLLIDERRSDSSVFERGLAAFG
jgi:hypothetical protein